MLTWTDVLAREVPCAKCQGTFRVQGPLDSASLSEIRRLLEQGQGISAIRLIRELTGTGLRDAKRMYEHVTIFRGRCRQCSAPLRETPLDDCSACGAFNIDA